MVRSQVWNSFSSVCLEVPSDPDLGILFPPGSRHTPVRVAVGRLALCQAQDLPVHMVSMRMVVMSPACIEDDSVSPLVEAQQAEEFALVVSCKSIASW